MLMESIDEYTLDNREWIVTKKNKVEKCIKIVEVGNEWYRVKGYNRLCSREQ